MRFFTFYSAYALIVVALLTVADLNGWMFSHLLRSGSGRTYNAYNHK
jgi:hypothetical protein